MLLTVEQAVYYFAVSCVACVAVIAAGRLVFLRPSKQVPVFRIAPDSRTSVASLESCSWVQAIADRLYRIYVVELPEDDLREKVQGRLDKLLQMTPGKCDLTHIHFGGVAPRICGVSVTKETNNRVAMLMDVFYNGDFSASLSLEHMVHMPFFGSSLFPLQLNFESIDIQFRLKAVWDSAEHFQGPAGEALHRAFLHPHPDSKSHFELSLLDMPDVSVKVSSQIGARHKIVDSQTLTSFCAMRVRRWLAMTLIYPNKFTWSTTLPSILIPAITDRKEAHTGDQVPSVRQAQPPCAEGRRKKSSRADRHPSPDCASERSADSTWHRSAVPQHSAEVQTLHRGAAVGRRRILSDNSFSASRPRATPPASSEQWGRQARGVDGRSPAPTSARFAAWPSGAPREPSKEKIEGPGYVVTSKESSALSSLLHNEAENIGRVCLSYQKLKPRGGAGDSVWWGMSPGAIASAAAVAVAVCSSSGDVWSVVQVPSSRLPQPLGRRPRGALAAATAALAVVATGSSPNPPRAGNFWQTFARRIARGGSSSTEPSLAATLALAACVAFSSV